MPRGPKLLSIIFAIAGVAHFLVPDAFDRIIPPPLPAKRALTYLSGAAELGCAAGLRAERPWARVTSAGLLLAVWPANIHMAVDASRRHRPWWHQAGLWARVPMQLPMVAMALRRPALRRPVPAAPA